MREDDAKVEEDQGEEEHADTQPHPPAVRGDVSADFTRPGDAAARFL